MTDAEKHLWAALRAHRLRGLSFRRQSPIGPFIADFICHDRKLIIEVDGGQHAETTRDVSRDQWLASHGYRVLRFWNSDVLRNRTGVLDAIAETLGDPPPRPSPSRGEGVQGQ